MYLGVVDDDGRYQCIGRRRERVSGEEHRATVLLWQMPRS